MMWCLKSYVSVLPMKIVITAQRTHAKHIHSYEYGGINERI